MAASPLTDPQFDEIMSADGARIARALTKGGPNARTSTLEASIGGAWTIPQRRTFVYAVRMADGHVNTTNAPGALQRAHMSARVKDSRARVRAAARAARNATPTATADTADAA